MVSRSCKEDLPTKEQGRFFGIAGKSSVELRMVAGLAGLARAGGKRAERLAQIRRDYAWLGSRNQRIVTAAEERG
jgi:hypothetical protein